PAPAHARLSALARFPALQERHRTARIAEVGSSVRLPSVSPSGSPNRKLRHGCRGEMSMSERVELDFHGRRLIVETGKVAKQAGGAAWVQYGETVVLVTATASRSPREGIDFFPLTCDYQEKTFAAGKIPGGFFKREGRPAEKEILTSRLIDRPIRPLFPKGFNCEIQVIATVLSHDRENDPDVIAMFGASIALTLSDIPFAGPIAAVRMGRVGGKLVVNPTTSQL